MAKYIVASPVIGTKTLRSKESAKKHMQTAMKEKRIMGLSATINTVNKDGSGKLEQFFTSRDGKYTVRGPVRTKKYHPIKKRK